MTEWTSICNLNSFEIPWCQGNPFQTLLHKRDRTLACKGKRRSLYTFHGYMVKQVWWPCWDKKQYKVHLSKNHSRKSLSALISGPALLNGGG